MKKQFMHHYDKAVVATAMLLFLLSIVSFSFTFLSYLSLSVSGVLLAVGVLHLLMNDQGRDPDEILLTHIKKKNERIRDLEEKNKVLIKSSMRTAERATELSRKVGSLLEAGPKKK